MNPPIAADDRLGVAVECSKFEADEGVHMNVNNEEMGALTPEEWARYEAWEHGR